MSILEHQEKAVPSVQSTATVTVLSPVMVSELIQSYHDYNESRNLRPRTLLWYREALRQFETFVGSDTPASNITTRTIDSYRLALKRRGLAVESINNYLRAVQGLVTWAADREYLPRRPKVEFAKKDVMPPKPAITPEDFEKLMEAANQETPLLLQLRARAILSLLFDCGMRASELCAARWADISHIEIDGRPAHLLKIEGAKRGGYRYCIISEYAWQHITAYREELARPHGRGYRKKGQEPVTLFVGRYFGPMTVSSLQRLCYRLAARSNVKLSPHALRRGFATEFLNNSGGEAIDLLMKLGGWKSREMVEVYAQVRTQTLARAAGKYSPLAKK